MATETEALTTSPKASSPEPPHAAVMEPAVVHRQDSTTDEAAPFVVVDKEEPEQARRTPAALSPKVATPKSPHKPKLHLEQRHRRHLFLGAIKFSINLGHLLSRIGFRNARHKPLRRSCRLSGGVRRARITHVHHAKAEIAGVKVRIYTPVKKAPVHGPHDHVDGDKTPAPVVVYLHGGGFVVCSARSYHPFSLNLCKQLGATVVSVDYRLAPENPFPAGLNDCVGVTRALLNADVNPDQVGPQLAGRVAVDRVVLAGDSAGGNLAAGVALELNRTGETRRPHALLLVCPALQAFTKDLDSYHKFNKHWKVGMSWYLAQYAGVEPRQGLLKLLDKDRHVNDETKLRLMKFLKSSSAANGEAQAASGASVPDSGCQTASSSLPSPGSRDQRKDEKTGEDKADEHVVGLEKEEAATTAVATTSPTHHADVEHVETEQLIEAALDIPDAVTELATNPRAWPLLVEDAELAKLPTTMIMVCSDDPLLDEGRIFYERMCHSGAPDVRYFYLPRAQHGEPVLDYLLRSKSSARGFSEMVAFLKDVTGLSGLTTLPNTPLPTAVAETLTVESTKVENKVTVVDADEVAKINDEGGVRIEEVFDEPEASKKVDEENAINEGIATENGEKATEEAS